MTPWVIIALLLINAVLLALCGVLTWLWRDQRKTIDVLARALVDALKDIPDEVLRRRLLRAIDSGDAAGLPPWPPGADR